MDPMNTLDFATYEDHYQRRFQSSTPISTGYSSMQSNPATTGPAYNGYPITPNSSPTRMRAQIEELQCTMSKLALENEELKFELSQTRRDFEELSMENQQMYQSLQEKEALQTKMAKQLDIVTKTAYALYEKFRALKCRYYQEQIPANACMGCAPPAAGDAD